MSTTATPTGAAPKVPVDVKRRDASNPLTTGRLPSWSIWAILAGALALGALVVFLITQLGGGGDFNVVGALVLGGIFYLIAVWVISRMVEGSRQASNRFVTSLVVTAFVLALIPLVSLILTLFTHGLDRLDPLFFTSSMQGVKPSEEGGAVHAIWGTLLITLTATLISVPVGIFTAIYLVEYGKGGWLQRSINFLVDVMTGIPSIVAGLFVFTMALAIAGASGAAMTTVKTGFSGALALSILMLPTVIRSSEEMLRLVPMDLREASYALGVPKWLTVVKVVLRTALAGIATGVTLAISRVIGETAPLLIATGAFAALNTDLFHNQMMSLPVFVYQMTKGQGPSAALWMEMAWTSALVLLVIVMLLNLIARLIAWAARPKGSR